jgi:hypothetical protein
MLVSLSDMKAYLNIPEETTTWDVFLTQQLNVISDTIESYCGRKFSSAEYIQTFYWKDYNETINHLQLFQYPIIEISSIVDDEVAITDYRLHKASGSLTRDYGFFQGRTEVVATYTAGFTSIPSPIQQVVYSLVEERYNKKVSGVALNFGSDVQSISIPGVINVAFDYSLDYNQRKNAYGTILGSYSNVLDPWRSERVIIGSGKLEYVE